jgi:hypothetical protein
MTIPSSGPVTFTDIQTEFGGTNPIGLNEYYAGGGLVPAATSGTYGPVPSSGQISVQNFYGTTAFTPVYIEEVFSTYLYTGTGSAQTITNGIDLSTNGGLVWIKKRNGVELQQWWTTVLGNTSYLRSNGTQTLFNSGSASITYNTTGFSLNTGSSANNQSGDRYAGWTFREKPKFFDVVTGVQAVPTTTINHNLGSVPGLIIVKNTNNIDNQWYVYHRSLGTGLYLTLETNDAAGSGFSAWGGVAPTSTQFTIGYQYPPGTAFVAYLFAHDAGGFGLTGTDNVVSCASYTGNGSANGPVINLGYEPQWVMIKQSSGSNDWEMYDNMRGVATGGNDALLRPNTSGPEEGTSDILSFTSTGFQLTNIYSNTNGSGQTYIYVAIRRGPMKVPTVGTTVFSPIQATTGTQTTNFPIDLQIATANTTTDNREFSDRLRGFNSPNLVANRPWLASNLTNAEATNASFSRAWNNTGFLVPPYYDGGTAIYWSFRRAPSFFDEVCYTVSGYAANNVAHNLTVTPEIFITKPRGSTGGWTVYGSVVGSTNNYMTLNNTQALQTSGGTVWGATSSTFSEPSTVQNGTYVCYLFATCAGVSKVGSYTGTGATQTINCGFTGGARFVLIKQTNNTGDWYVFDTARGMVSGTDPNLSINTTAVEYNVDSVFSVATGFQLTASSPIALNINGGTYIFLAIA